MTNNKIIKNTLFFVIFLNSMVSYAQRFPFRDGDKWGVVGLTGSTILEVKYDEILPFVYDNTKKNLARVKLDGKYGFIESTLCRLVIPIIYDEATSFNKGFAQVKKDGETFIINQDGQKVNNGNYVPRTLSDVYFLEQDLKTFSSKIDKENWPQSINKNNTKNVYKISPYDSLYLAENLDNSIRLQEGKKIFLSDTYDSISIYTNYIFVAYKNNSITLYNKIKGENWGGIGSEIEEVIFFVKKDNNVPVFIVRKDQLWGVWQPDSRKNGYKYKKIEPCPETPSVFKATLTNNEVGYIISTVGWELF